MYINGKHENINVDHVVLIEQRDWSVSNAYVSYVTTRYAIRLCLKLCLTRSMDDTVSSGLPKIVCSQSKQCKIRRVP